MLDNVVEVHGLPLEQQAEEIRYKRRHGMGFLGLGSALTMLRMKYGESSPWNHRASAREMAQVGWETGSSCRGERPAPIMLDTFDITPEMLARRPEMARDGYSVGDKVADRCNRQIQPLHAAI
jgi:ribonucleoside-diphosphate reductase alpha chain